MLNTIVSWVLGLGAGTMMPIILTIFAMILGAKFGKALRAGLTVGIGLIGLNLVIGLLGGNLAPAVTEMSKSMGLTLSVIDLGWPPSAAIAWASQIGALTIPIGLIVNILMLVTKTTQTVNIDIWNFWHYAFIGALVQFATGSIVYGIIATIFTIIIIQILADITAPGVEEYLGLPGVSIPHGFSTGIVPVALAINWVLNFIPGINKITLNPETVQKKLGVFGEPILIGTFLGMLIGIAAGRPIGTGTGWLSLGVIMGAVLVLIPRMSGLLMEGLIPISEAAEEFINKKFENAGKLYIGLDSAVGIGHPTTLAVALILVPVSIFLAVALPGNKFLPAADLAALPFMFVMIVPITKGDIIRTLIIGIVLLICGFYIASALSPGFTDAAINAKYDLKGMKAVSSIFDGASPLVWVMTVIFKLKAIGAVIVGVICAGLMVWNRKRIIAEAKAEKAAEIAEKKAASK